MAGTFGNYGGFMEMLEVKSVLRFSSSQEKKWANAIQKIIIKVKGRFSKLHTSELPLSSRKSIEMDYDHLVFSSVIQLVEKRNA